MMPDKCYKIAFSNWLCLISISDTLKKRKRITKIHLFASLVDLAQEHLKHLLLEALALINLVDQLHELGGTLLLESLVSLL